MKTLKERVQHAIDEGFTVGQLSAAAGKSSSAASQWLSGQTKTLKADSAVGLEALTGWNATWWVTGKGERGQTRRPLSAVVKASPSLKATLTNGKATGQVVALSVSPAAPNVSPLSREDSMRLLPPAEGYVRLPILAEAAAGAGRSPDAFELVEHVDVAEQWVRRTLGANPANLRVLTARGQSMAAPGSPSHIADGDVMFVAPTTDFVDDGTYIISIGGLLRVKRLRLLIDKTLSIESNDGSAPETIPQSQIDEALHICGRVIGAWSLRRL